tara:strand:- start:274 stop:975 length:702 start_codon:yes stop_codon:yes gene_type:complete
MGFTTLPTDPVAAPVKQTLASSYLDFSTGWAQQHLPELYEAEVERYGNRSLSGFLAKVGAEEAMQSDKVVWSEQGRLHISIKGVTLDESTGIIGFANAAEAELIRKHDTLLMYCTAGTSVGKTVKVLVTTLLTDSLASGTDALGITVVPYAFADMTTSNSTFADDSVFTVMVFGSEYAKGSTADRHALTPSFQTFDNKPIIMRDVYEINGSDTAKLDGLKFLVKKDKMVTCGT